jgi:AraC-like DNA-binding protein
MYCAEEPQMKYNILVVADSKTVAAEISEQIVARDLCQFEFEYEVLPVKSRARGFDVLILDVSSGHREDEYGELLSGYDRLNTEIILVGEYTQLRLLSELRGSAFAEILLKPIRPEELDFSLQRIIDKIDARKAVSVAPLRVENLWARVRPILLEQFWTELAYGKMPAIPLALEQSGRSVGLANLDAMRVIPLFLSHNLRHGQSAIPKDLRLTYRKMMTEAVFTDPGVLFSFAYDNDCQIVILQFSGTYENDKAHIAEACGIYQKEMAMQLNMDVACFVGFPAALLELPKIIRSLLKLAEIEAIAGKDIVFFEDANDEEWGALEKARRYIAIHISEDIRRDDLAENTNYSKNYLARVFRGSLGVSIFDYITHERMKLAYKFLAETNIPIVRVAEKCGIPDSGYFSTLFKKETGLSPKKYRKMNEKF